MSQDRPQFQVVTIPVTVMGIDTKVEVCPFEALDAIIASRKQDESQWLDLFRHWIADKLDTPPEKLHPQQVEFFNNVVIELVEKLREVRKKKLSETVDWLLSIQESLATSEGGVTSLKTSG